MNYQYVSWVRLHDLTYLLSQKIKKSNRHFDRIVTISRGGLTIGHLMSDFLELPVSTIAISSYKTIGQKKKPAIKEKLSVEVAGSSILLLDDVADSGGTLICATNYLKKHGARSVTAATLHIKPHADLLPDFFVAKTTRWLIYPTELYESITTLSRKWQAAGENVAIIKQKLSALKLPKKFINTFVS